MDNLDRRYKSIAAWTIILFVIYFVFGLISVGFNLITFNTYIILGGIIGGVVSVVGLLSFFRPSMTQADIQKLQLESLREIAESSSKLENLEKARLAAENDISSLELRKQQMEVLVRKASLSLFLQEQHNLYSNRALEAVSRNNELAEDLKKLSEIKVKLRALDEDVKNDENVDLLLEIINDARKRSSDESGLTIKLGSSMIELILETAANLFRFVK